jgi:hypothetical protein
MDVRVRLDHELGAHLCTAALAGIDLHVLARGLLVSTHILILNYRQQDEITIKDGLTLDD